MVCGSLTSKALPACGVSFTNTGGEPEEESKFTVFIKNCSGTIEIGSFGVYSLLPMMMFVLGKSSMDKATAYIPLSAWVALNVIVHVS